MSNYADNPKCQDAMKQAQIMADRTGDRYRVFKGYGLFCIRPAVNPYEGEHVSFVDPKPFRREQQTALDLD